MHRAYQIFSPFREPKWRLNRVLTLVDHEPRPLRSSRRRDDAYIMAYRKFLLKFRTCEDDEARLAMFPAFPGLFYAHLLYYHPDREWRALVEACILAGMPDEEVAAELSTLPETVTWYERIFFNVRDRLDCEIWIIKNLLGRPEERRGGQDGRISDDQWAMLLKLFGYYGGPAVLKVLLAGFQRRGQRPRSAEEVRDWYDEAAITNIRRQAVAGARTFEVNKYNIMQLLDLHTRLLELARATEQGAPSSDVEQNVEALIHGLSWTAGAAGRMKAAPALLTFQDTDAELRADEALAMAAGYPVETEGVQQLRIAVSSEQEQKEGK